MLDLWIKFDKDDRIIDIVRIEVQTDNSGAPSGTVVTDMAQIFQPLNQLK